MPLSTIPFRLSRALGSLTHPRGSAPWVRERLLGGMRLDCQDLLEIEANEILRQWSAQIPDASLSSGQVMGLKMLFVPHECKIDMQAWAHTLAEQKKWKTLGSLIPALYDQKISASMMNALLSSPNAVPNVLMAMCTHEVAKRCVDSLKQANRQSYFTQNSRAVAQFSFDSAWRSSDMSGLLETWLKAVDFQGPVVEGSATWEHLMMALDLLTRPLKEQITMSSNFEQVQHFRAQIDSRLRRTRLSQISASRASAAVDLPI